MSSLFGTRNPEHYVHYVMTFCPITMLSSPFWMALFVDKVQLWNYTHQ